MIFFCGSTYSKRYLAKLRRKKFWLPYLFHKTLNSYSYLLCSFYKENLNRNAVNYPLLWDIILFWKKEIWAEINNRTNVDPTLDTDLWISESESRRIVEMIMMYCVGTAPVSSVTNIFSTLVDKITKILVIYFFYWIHVLRIKTYFKED